MAISYTALATEINTDPLAYGYAQYVAGGAYNAIVSLLDKVRDGTDGKAAITVKRPDCAPSEILEAIDIRDFQATPTGVNNMTMASAWLTSVTQLSRIRLTNDDGTKTVVRKNIDRISSDTQGSQTRLDAVAVRFGSRSEQLFGVGVAVTSDDVGKALGGVP